MATADQVKALIRSHAEGDDTRFYAIAIQVAAQAAQSGHGDNAVTEHEAPCSCLPSSRRSQTSHQLVSSFVG